MNPDMPVVSIKDLNEKTPPCIGIVGRVTRVFPPETSKGKKPQALQKFILDDRTGSVMVYLYGNLASQAATLFHGNNYPVIRLENFDTKKNINSKEQQFILFSVWDWKPTKTKIFEIKDPDQIQGVLIHSSNPIDKIKDYKENSYTDVLGIALSIFSVKEKVVNSQSQKRREIHLYDSSGSQVSVTLWGDHAVGFTYPENTVVSIRGAKVCKFRGGTTLSVSSSATIQINPSTTEAANLQTWHQEKPIGFQFFNISDSISSPSSLLTIGEVLAEVIADPAAFTECKIQANVQIVLVKGAENDFKDHFYESCPVKTCNKGVMGFNGKYFCSTCNKWFSSFKRVMTLPVELENTSGSFTTTIFQKQLEQIIPLSCTSLYLMSKSDSHFYKSILEQHLRNKEFEATVLITKGEFGLKWALQKFTEMASTPVNVSDVINHTINQADNEKRDDAENADQLNPHLGLIEEIDAVPQEWRDENTMQ